MAVTRMSAYTITLLAAVYTTLFLVELRLMLVLRDDHYAVREVRQDPALRGESPR